MRVLRCASSCGHSPVSFRLANGDAVPCVFWSETRAIQSCAASRSRALPHLPAMCHYSLLGVQAGIMKSM